MNQEYLVREVEYDGTIRSLLAQNDLPVEDIPTNETLFYEAVLGGERVGIGALQPVPEAALLRSIVVEKRYRGRGYGTMLVQRLIEEAGRIPVNDLYLFTTSAKPFFERIGFQSISRDEAPAGIQSTAQFQHLCPDTAAFMKMKI